MVTPKLLNAYSVPTVAVGVIENFSGELGVVRRIVDSNILYVNILRQIVGGVMRCQLH